MRILIFGAGALGQALGCMLSGSGQDVDMVLRGRFAEAIKTNGLKVSGLFGDHSADLKSLGVYTDVNAIKDKRYDYSIITTKSYDTEIAVKDISKLSVTPSFIVSMQNGCGNYEKVIDAFGRDRSLAARVITGFRIESPGNIKITVSADSVHIGGPIENEIPESARILADAINSSGLPCSATGFIRRDLFAKLLYSCALNPLGAILGVHYGLLGESSFTRALMDKVIDEVFAVINAMGQKTHWETSSEYRKLFYDQQLPTTYEHRSSMLQDIETGKRTEIDSLTGYVVCQGKKYGIDTPVCETLSEIIRFKEKEASGKL